MNEPAARAEGRVSLRVLLTHAYCLEEDPKEKRIMRPYPPLGLLYVAAYLRERGVEVAVHDATFGTRTDLEAAIRAARPDVLGVYTNLMTRADVVRLLRFVKSEPTLRHTRVVLGGPEITHHVDEFLGAAADVLVIGEGEATMHELLVAWSRTKVSLTDPLAGVAGLAYRGRGGNIVRTASRELMPSLDALPLPARDAIDLGPYLRAWRTHHGKNALSISTMRGCPYSCRWCSRAVYGGSYRRRSPALVADEIAMLVERYAPDTLWFVDDVFTINHRWLAEFTDELEKRNLRVPYECITRADRLNEKAVELLRRSGCFRVWIGAESGSQVILDAMDRRVKVEQVRAMIELAQQQGIEAGTFIMVGYPGETPSDIEQTIDHLKRSMPDQFTITVSYPIRGTPLYDEVAPTLIRPKAWAESSDRDLLIAHEHSSLYYRFVIRRVVHEVEAHRIRSRGDVRGRAKKVRHRALAWAARAGMELDPWLRRAEDGWKRATR